MKTDLYLKDVRLTLRIEPREALGVRAVYRRFSPERHKIMAVTRSVWTALAERSGDSAFGTLPRPARIQFDMRTANCIFLRSRQHSATRHYDYKIQP
jgi:hypothetical protein